MDANKKKDNEDLASKIGGFIGSVLGNICGVLIPLIVLGFFLWVIL